MKDKYFLLKIYCIALAVGILFIVFNPHPHGPWGFDGYDILGWNLAQENGYSFAESAPFDRTAFRLPAYPILLSIFYRIFGHRYMPVFIFQALLNAFICIFIFYLIKDTFERKLVFWICFLVALLGFSNIYVSILSTDMITTFLIVLAILLLYIGYKQNRSLFYFIHGVILSLVVLMRPAIILFPIFYFVSLFFILKEHQKAIRYLCLSIFAMGLLISPWVIRNYMLSQNVVILGTQGGQQFFYGSMETGPYFNCRVYNPYHKYAEKLVDKIDEPGLQGEIKQQNLYYRLALSYIAGHPRDYFFANLKRMVRMWITVGSYDRTISHPAPWGMNSFFVLAKYFTLSIFLFCLSGIFIMKRRLKDIIFVLVPIVYFPLTHSFFMVNARHTLPANPFVFVFAGVSLFYGIGKYKNIRYHCKNRIRVIAKRFSCLFNRVCTIFKRTEQ